MADTPSGSQGRDTTPTPPDGAGTPTAATAGAQGVSERPLDSLTVDELQAKADELGLQVQGTGADDRVVKADLVGALQAAASGPQAGGVTGDAEPASVEEGDTSGRPDLAAVAAERAANRNVRVIGAQEEE